MDSLRSFVPEKNPESATGALLLEGIQSYAKPRLDLLVREAIQNSSDAAVGDGGYVDVDFDTGEFKPRELNALLEGIGPKLSNRFPDSIADYLVVRDDCTSGLTGGVHVYDPEESINPGNYCKLVFGIGEKQQQTGAGGSRGLGKSMYFQMGIGLVMLYSRIRIEAGFESRLVFVFAENQTAKASLLDGLSAAPVGRAWWGEVGGREIEPVTDEARVGAILSIFKGLEPFVREETGTAVVIPYVDKGALLSEARDALCDYLPEAKRKSIPWLNDFEDYLSYSIQKWYFPRLFNDAVANASDYKLKALHAFVGGAPINDKAMHPLFLAQRDLYTYALSKLSGFEYQPSILPPQDIECRETLNGDGILKRSGAKVVTGYVSTLRIDARRFNELDLGSLSPGVFLGIAEEGSAPKPIVMYCREPGMILGYSDSDKWVTGVSLEDGNYSLSLYLPDWKRELKEEVWEKVRPSDDGITSVRTLGDYLRYGERADHTEWNDVAKCRLIENIKRRVREHTVPAIVKPAISPEVGTSRISSELGRLLLPKEGYGSMGSSSGGGGGGRNSTDKLTLEVLGAKHGEETIELDFDLYLPKAGLGFVSCSVEVDGSKPINEETWTKEYVVNFPFSITQVRICTVLTSAERKEGLDIEITPGNCQQIDNAVTAEIGSSSVEFKTDDSPISLSGKMTLKASSRKYCCRLQEGYRK